MDPKRVYIDWHYGEVKGVWDFSRKVWDELSPDNREATCNERLLDEIRKIDSADYKVRPLPKVDDDEELRPQVESLGQEEPTGPGERGEEGERPAAPAPAPKRGRKPRGVRPGEGS